MAAGHGVDRTRRGSTAREPSNLRAGREASKTARAKARRERHNERHLQPQAGRAAAALALSRADLVLGAFGVDALKQLAAQPTPRLDRSPWQGFGTATDASASIELGFGESGWQPA